MAHRKPRADFLRADFMDKLEYALARALGRASWPFTNARLESQLTVNSSNAQARSSGSSFSCFSYEVDGVVYVSAVRRFWWRESFQRRASRRGQSPQSTGIQYNPRNPQHAYFAPAHTLLNHCIAILSILAIVLFVIEVAP